MTQDFSPSPAPAPKLETLRCWAEVDLAALRANAAHLKEIAGAPLLCIVKANAYGHGALPVTEALRAETSWFGVANVREAAELTAVLGPEDSVVIMGPAVPAERPEIVQRRFVPLLSSLAEAADYSRLALELDPEGAALPVHVKVDTGMGRMGIPVEGALDVILAIHALPGISIAGLATHLPAADDDPAGAGRQLARWGEFLRAAEAAGLPRLPWHAQNSAGFILNRDSAGAAPGWVRPGLTLYGISPTGDDQAALRRPLTWKARVALVRELPAGHGVSYGSTFIAQRPTRVVTLSAGYADGYPRVISNRGADVLLQGRRCPILGRITMDLIMVDGTDLPHPPVPGDEAILLGTAGDEIITAEELAQKAGTIPWEIFTNLSSRVTRVYLGLEESF